MSVAALLPAASPACGDDTRFQPLAAGWPIADIAPAVGLVDLAHFTRLFKRLYGLTPARYQQQSGSRPLH
ncbi:helix-turn-helix domain-containing protein [Leeia aquatica]|uniref:helix-turn-helix domain-containing protein n=1 Tax=Leeia aquatica TaxID=2725557 RepID=UPI001981472C|nr:AraC family transcriptional regulator [Leeia aquatica]